ncbi:MAG TPA: hypothetical protein VJB82_05090 [Candidatus Peribacterales bacterium]|nr:hypothetical protein [Candidatus Peribacterales bacterium]
MAFNSMHSRFISLHHLIDEHRATIETLFAKHCPEVSVLCTDLHPLQKQIEGYFSLIRGEANSQSEQSLIVNEQREYDGIFERIKRIFAEKELSQIELTVGEGVANKEDGFPINQLKGVWQKHLGTFTNRISTWTYEKDKLPEGIMLKLKTGMKSIQDDFPSQVIDNMIYIERLQETIDSLLDDVDRMIIVSEDDQIELFRCFDLFAARRKNELAQALRRLSQGQRQMYNEMVAEISEPFPGVDQSVSIRDVITGARVHVEDQMINMKIFAANLRASVIAAIAEIDALVSEKYSLKARNDIHEPMAWRSDLIEELEDHEKEFHESNIEGWFKEKDDNELKYKRFANSTHGRHFVREDTKYVQHVKQVAERFPLLYKREDIDRFQKEIDVAAPKYGDMVTRLVVPYVGKGVAKILLNRFDMICKSVGFNADGLLLSTDIGYSEDDIDSKVLTERADVLTLAEIEQQLGPFMVRLCRSYTQEYAKFGGKSLAKSNARAHGRVIRMLMREQPEKISSFEELFALITVPLILDEGALDLSKRERIVREGTVEGLGNTLDEAGCAVFAREYRRFTGVLRKRMWNFRRNSTSQKTTEEEVAESNKEKYALISKEKIRGEFASYVSMYQLQNGATEILAKIDPELQDRVIVARDSVNEGIAQLFSTQGNQISHDELVTLKASVLNECNTLRKEVPLIEARDYFDLIEESYRYVFYNFERDMKLGATMLEWNKQSDLLKAIEGARGRAASTEPDEYEFALAELSNPGTSSLLQLPVPPGFAEALTTNPFNGEIITREVQRAFRTLEKELPLAIGFGSVDSGVRLLPLLNQCRDTCIAGVNEVTDTQPVNSINVFEQLFGRLGWVFDQLQSRFKGVMHGFLAQRFIALRQRLQDQTLRRVEQEEMRQALATTNDSRIQMGQYQTFFIQYAQNLLTERCRQFLYSCITPAMNAEQIGQVGAAINGAVQTVMTFLTQRIAARCAKARGPLALSELQECFTETAQLDVSTLGLPPGTEERFRAQVLNYLANDLSRITTPDGLIGAYGVPSASEDYSSLVQRTVTTVLDVHEREALIPLRQTAREQYMQCLRYIEALRGGITELHIWEDADQESAQRLHHLMDGLAALRFSLYAPAEKRVDTQGNNFTQSIAHLEVLQTTILELHNRVQRADEEPHARRNAIETISNLTDTLKGLIHFLYQKS